MESSDVSSSRPLDLADPGGDDRGLHWIIFERGHLSGAAGHVSEQAEPVVLPNLQKSTERLAEFADC